MPISYKINAARQRVFTFVAGEVTALEIIDHFETVRREGFLAYSEFIDASSIVNPTLSVAELWNIAVTLRNLQKQGNFGCRAVWVGSDINFVLAHMFASLLSGFIRMRVFHDRLAAEEWLNRPNSREVVSFKSSDSASRTVNR